MVGIEINIVHRLAMHDLDIGRDTDNITQIQ